ncbi:unnamed protein product, partial [Pelagomonas calceolata]
RELCKKQRDAAVLGPSERVAYGAQRIQDGLTSAALPHAATAPHLHTLQPASKYLQRGAFDSIDASDTKNSAWPRAEDACITVIICKRHARSYARSRVRRKRCRPPPQHDLRPAQRRVFVVGAA